MSAAESGFGAAGFGAADFLALVLYGSRGDVQPGVCVALELRRRGYRVAVVVPPNLVGFATAAGLDEVYAVGHDTDRQWSSDQALDAQRSSNTLARAGFALRTVRASIAAFDAGMRELFINADAPLRAVNLVVAAPLCQARALAVTERLAIPLVVLRYAPMSDNGVIGPATGVFDRWSAPWTHRAWQAYDRALWAVTGKNENNFRRSVGRPPVSTPCSQRLAVLRVPQIQAFDPAIVPEVVAEWDADPLIRKPVVGFLDLPRDTRTVMSEAGSEQARLAQWLSEGTAPIFVGFGSMPVADRAAVIATVAAATRQAGVRAVISLGRRAGPDPDEPHIFHVGAVDHSWLLPQCLAAVHHGGAGTTAATLRAGLPAVIYAISAEQPFWARRVAMLGVGTGRRFSALDAEHLRIDITTATGVHMRAAAAEFAGRMISPEGAASAAADIVTAALA